MSLIDWRNLGNIKRDTSQVSNFANTDFSNNLIDWSVINARPKELEKVNKIAELRRQSEESQKKADMPIWKRLFTKDVWKETLPEFKKKETYTKTLPELFKIGAKAVAPSYFYPSEFKKRQEELKQIPQEFKQGKYLDILKTLGKQGLQKQLGITEAGISALPFGKAKTFGQFIKGGASVGTGLGAIQTAKQGIEEKKLPTAKDTLTNLLGGALVGGTLAGGGYGVSKLFGRKLPKTLQALSSDTKAKEPSVISDLVGKKLTVEKGAFKGIPITKRINTPISKKKELDWNTATNEQISDDIFKRANEPVDNSQVDYDNLPFPIKKETQEIAPKISKDYYWYDLMNGKFAKAEKAIPVKNNYGLDLFVHKGKTGWVLSETKSGAAVGKAFRTRKAAIASLSDTMDIVKERGINVDETINEATKKYGISPRYKQEIRPEVKQTIKEYKESGEAGFAKLPNVDLQKIAEQGKKLSYFFKPLKQQLPKGAFGLLKGLQRETSKNIEEVQGLVGEKLTKPGVTKALTKFFPYSNPANIQKKARALRNIPLVGKYFGIDRNEQKILFKVAEAIKEVKNGKPTFGTKIIKKSEKITGYEADGKRFNTYKEAAKYLVDIDQAHKIQFIKTAKERIPTGEVQTRYTPEEGQAMFDNLSEQGKKAVLEYAKPAVEAKDVFNRELTKQVFKINSDIEGYMHHFGFEGKPLIQTFKKIFFSAKKAAPKQLRGEAQGFRELFESAKIKELTDLMNAKAYNKFIVKFEEQLSEPITKGNSLHKGWAQTTGKFGKLKGQKIQVPNAIYDEYKRYVEPAKEASVAGQLLNGIGNYYKANLLLHPGTVETNIVGQTLLYASKISDDFWGKAILSKDPKPLLNDIKALYRALLPSYVKKTPSYLWGEEAQVSSYLGEERNLGKGIMSKLLIPFRSADTLWKRIVTLSELPNKMGGKQFKKADANEIYNLQKEIMDEIDSAVDLYALDYTNVPKALEKFRKMPGSFLIAPFPTYYYKFSQHVGHYLNALNPKAKMTTKDRATRILTLSTLLSLAAYADNRSERKTSEYIPEIKNITQGMDWQYETAGRIKTGETSEGEEYLRVAKYPWMNIYIAGKGVFDLAQGYTGGNEQKVSKGWGVLSQLKEEMITPGAGFDIYNISTGQRNKFERYKSGEVKTGELLGELIPGFRTTEGIKNILYPQKKYPQTFLQALSKGIPGIKPQGKEATEGITKYKTKEELLKLLFGMNIRTVKPEDAKKEREKILNRIQYNIDKENYDEIERDKAKKLLKMLRK